MTNPAASRATILDNLSTAVVSLNSELQICSINSAAESLLAVSARRSIGACITEVVPGFGCFTEILRTSSETGQPYTQRMAELTLSADNTATVDFTVSPVDESGQLILEFHPLDRYLRIDRDASLQQHQKVSRQIMRGLAHEVKNPLGGIRGSAQLLDRQLNDPDLTEYTRIIINESDRLAHLVDRMLGSRDRVNPTPTNIHELLEKMRRLLLMENRIALEEQNLSVICDYDPSIPELMIDPEMIYQALINVARNALGSMASVADPRLKLSTRTERQFTIDGVRHRTVLRIDIADNGCGVPEELKEHMFFPMISGRVGSMGLGLPYVQDAVRRHHGIVEFDSRPGETIFRIFLPLQQDTQP